MSSEDQDSSPTGDEFHSDSDAPEPPDKARARRSDDDEEDDPSQDGPASDGASERGSKRGSEPAARYSRRAIIAALAAGLIVGGGGGFGGGYWYARPRRRRSPRPPMKPAFVPVAPHNPRRGALPAKVTIVLFSEFQCPFCVKIKPTLAKILSEYEGEVALVFKHRPLKMHKQARGAAVAMQAALRQQRAWELHDIMFEHRKQLDPDKLNDYAKQAELDVSRFKKDLDDPKLAEEVNADEKLAEEVGARGTPATFINGRPVRGAKPYEAFAKIVDEELKRANELIAGGTPLADVYATRAKELVAEARKKAK